MSGAEDVLAPLPRTNRLVAAVGIVCALVGGYVLLAAGNRPSGAAISVALIGFGVLAVVRGPRMRVVLADDRAVVHGLCWSRTVPRDRVVELTRFPGLVWNEASGRRHWTPITCLHTAANAPEWLAAHNGDHLDTLRRWSGIENPEA